MHDGFTNPVIQDTKIDAVFGTGMEEGEQEFQSEVGIGIDGVADLQTFEKLLV